MRGLKMHFDILVEDVSGEVMLENLMPKIIGEGHTFTIKHYKGIGKLPEGLKPGLDPSTRALLNQLPRLLRGYGNTYAKYPPSFKSALIVVCDLDNKNLDDFKSELYNLLERIIPKPETRFCFAIEECEAWLLGDFEAIQLAYPKAKKDVLSSYKNDSICGTWETLADAVYPKGLKALEAKGWHMVGYEKSQWAKNITPHMEVEKNKSPSFKYFCQKLHELMG